MSISRNVLLVLASEADRRSLPNPLRDSGVSVVVWDGPEEVSGETSPPIDVVVSDLTQQGSVGPPPISVWKQKAPGAQVIVLVADGSRRSGIEAMQLGAYGYLTRPLEMDELILTIGRAADLAEKDRELVALRGGTGAGGMVSPELSEAIAAIDQSNPGMNTPTDVQPNVTIEALERAAIMRSLDQSKGNRTHAAHKLGISVRTLQRKLRQYDSEKLRQSPKPESSPQQR